MLIDYESYLGLLNSGFYYGYGRDRGMRPIMIFNVRKWVDLGELGGDVNKILDLIEVMSLYIQVNAGIPGKIETFSTIIDVKDVGLTEVPYTQLAMIAQRLGQNNFARNYTSVAINLPYLLILATKIVKNF